MEVETKGKVHEGSGQAISYLSLSMKARHIQTGFCIYTDYWTIHFYHLDNSTENPTWTHSALPFMDPSQTEPTTGFLKLVRLFHCRPQQDGLLS